MDENEKYALTIRLMQFLADKGSWCGETHVQKSMYIFEKLNRVESTGFDFILYKHGPYSFPLRDILGDMRSLRFVNSVSMAPYGPKLKVTEAGDKFCTRFFDKEYEESLEKTTDLLKNSGVQRLEQLATALYIAQKSNNPDEDRAECLHKIKPHISYGTAFQVTKEIDSILETYS